MPQPQHSDFAALCAIVRQLDNESDHGIDHILATVGVDPDSLLYMSEQRALRAALMLPVGMTQLQSVYFDAFLTGLRFERGRRP